MLGFRSQIKVSWVFPTHDDGYYKKKKKEEGRQRRKAGRKGGRKEGKENIVSEKMWRNRNTVAFLVGM